MHPALPIPLALALLLAGCRTESITTPVAPDVVIVHAEPTGSWKLVEGEQLFGFVVRFEDPGSPLHAFFSVRNALHQELGLVDRHGRCFRYEPHERDPQWLGTGTVLAGARSILGASARAELVALEDAGPQASPTSQRDPP